MKRTTRWTTLACSTLLAVTLLTPSFAYAASAGSVYDQLKAQYPAKVTEMLNAGISEAQLQSFLQTVLSALQADTSITSANFDEKLLNHTAAASSADPDLQNKLMSALTMDEMLQILNKQIPSSWIPMRDVLKAEWAGSNSGTPPVPAPGGALPPSTGVPADGSPTPGTTEPGTTPGTTPPVPDVDNWYNSTQGANGVEVKTLLADKVQALWANKEERTPLRIVINGAAEVNVPKSLVASGQQMKQAIELAVARVGTVSVAFDRLPQGEVSFEVKAVTDATVEELFAMQNIELVGQGLELKAFVTESGKKRAVSLQGRGYSKTTVELPEFWNMSKVGAYLVDASGKLSPLPMTYTTDGGNVAHIHHTGTGTLVLGVKNGINLSDVSAHWSRANIEMLTAKTILTGYQDGTFRPNQKVTRAELVTMVTRALGLTGSAAGNLSFTDVAQDQWYQGAVTAAVEAGLVTGDPDGRFRPGDNVTRQEVAVIFSKALTLLDERLKTRSNTGFADLAIADRSDVSSWAQTAVAGVYGHKIMSGYTDNTFQAKGQTTRGEVAAMLVNLLDQSALITKK